MIAGNAGGDCLGGGINLHHASPTIAGNTIRDNTLGVTVGPGAVGSGAGIAIDCCYASSVVEDNVSRENRVTAHGGGIYQEETLARVRRNAIEDNEAAVGGDIASALYDAAMIEDNIIAGNAVERAGGGIWKATASSVTAGNVITGTLPGRMRAHCPVPAAMSRM